MLPAGSPATLPWKQIKPRLLFGSLESQHFAFYRDRTISLTKWFRQNKSVKVRFVETRTGLTPRTKTGLLLNKPSSNTVRYYWMRFGQKPRIIRTKL